MVGRKSLLLLTTLGLGAALLAGPSAGGAQTPENAAGDRPRVSDLIERTEVRVLLVDVVATDRAGDPIVDLEGDDFHLFIDKREVPIDSFEVRLRPTFKVTPAVDDDRGAAAPEPVATTANRVVLFFDSNNSRALDQQRVRESTLQFLTDSILPTDEVMVLSYSDRLRVLQPFSPDRSTWLAAVRTLVEDQAYLDPYVDGESNRVDRIYDLCLVAEDDRKRQAMMFGGPLGGGQTRDTQGGERTAGGEKGSTGTTGGTGGSTDPAIEGSCGAAWVAADQYMAEEFSRASHTLEALKGIIMAMRGMPGRKSVVFLSQGIRVTPGEEYYYAASCSACAASRFRSFLAQYSIENQIQELYREANNSNVAFHAFDTRTSRTLEQRPVQWKPGDPVAHPEGRYDFLTNLALQTGGMRGAPTESLDHRFRKLGARLGAYYVLGYTLPGERPDGETHKIRVEVDRDRVDLHHRRSFRDVGWREKEEETLQGALFLPEACRDLPIAARVLELHREASGSDAFIEMGVPFSSLFWFPVLKEEFSEVEFAGAVTDRWGRMKFQFRDWLELKRDADDADNRGQGVYFRERAGLDPGQYELTAVVHDLGGGKLGGIRVPFEIPEPDRKEFSVSRPALGKLSSGDMVVGADVPFASVGESKKEYRQEQVVPLLEDEISRREILVTFVQILDPAAPGPEPRPDYSVQVMFVRGGEVVGRHRPVRIGEELQAPSVTPFAIYSSLRRFEPGDYSVRVEVMDADTERKVTREVPLRIR